MNAHISKEAHGTCRNLKNGLRLLVFKRTDVDNFYVSQDQVLVLSLIYTVVIFLGSFVLSLPKPEFTFYGIATVATHLVFLALCGYFFSKAIDEKGQIIPLYIVLLSTWPFFYLGWLVIGKDNIFDFWQFYGESKYEYISFNIWIAAVVVSAVSRFSPDKKSTFLLLAIYVSTLGVPLNYLAFGNFWHQAVDYEAEYEKYKSINQETTYYRQFKLLNNIRTHLLPQREGVSDIYFVGFGSYAKQDVFMKEVKYAKKVLDKKFDTEGRSVALINNMHTQEDTLLASKSNLALVLEHIGTLIDPDEDVLFLYLTSHGSKKPQLSVNFTPLTLNSLEPSDLKVTLDNSGIKFRIILVSACYSGGFVEPLKDDYTLIFTASDKDKQSFGCSNMNDFTYFGKAIFMEQMEHNYDLIDAFNMAIKSIRARESSENLEHSEPQLYIGDRIKKKLLILSEEIKTYNHKISSDF